MNEILLFIVFAAIIFGGYFLLRKIPKPAISYARMSLAILMLVLIWWDWEVADKNRVPQIILTLLAISSLIREFFNLKKYYSHHNQVSKN
jgi:hypothetical protein